MRALYQIRFLLLLLLFAGMAFGLAIQHSRLSRLQMQAVQREEQLQAGQQEPVASSSVTSSGDAPQDHEDSQAQKLELLRLRNEVTQLRGKQQELEALRSENAQMKDLVKSLRQRALRPEQTAPELQPPFNAWIGVSVTLQKGNDNLEPGNVVVGGVAENSPAAEAQLMEGDILLAMNGEPVTNLVQFRTRIGSSPPGQPLTVDILRENVPRQITVVPKAPPSNWQIRQAPSR